MKILNFTCIEKLPSLLNKNCSQTIRRAWKEIIVSKDSKKKKDKDILEITGESGLHKYKLTEKIDKSARYEVGEIVRIMWKQRSKFHYFCRHCGIGLGIVSPWGKCKTCKTKMIQSEGNKHWFLDRMGIIEITEVFKLTMEKGEGYKILTEYSEGVHNTPLGKFKRRTRSNNILKSKETWVKELAKLDGFKSPEDMFKTIDKMYYLSSSKNFWVYKWKWCK